MKGDVDSPPGSIQDSSLDVDTVEAKPPELKQYIPPLLPMGHVILAPIIRTQEKKRVRISVWEIFLEFL